MTDNGSDGEFPTKMWSYPALGERITVGVRPGSDVLVSRREIPGDDWDEFGPSGWSPDG